MSNLISNVVHRLNASQARNCLLVSSRSVGKFTPIVEPEIEVREPIKRAKNRTRCYVWGGALSGALGRAHFVRYSVNQKAANPCRDYPYKIAFAETHTIKDIACGHGFTIFAARHDDRINNYELFGTGINADSQLGFQSANRKQPLELLAEPVPITFPTNEGAKRIHVIKVAAGRAHTIALTSEGTVYGLGNNHLGQCGRAIDPDETYFGRDLLKKVRIPAKVVGVVCGFDNTLFLTETGELYACGWGADGQTGLGHYKNTGVPELVKGDVEGVRIVKVACRADCVLAVSESGDVFGWGNNEYGQLLDSNGETQCHTPRHIPFNKKIKDVAACGSSCLALDESGNVFSWGFGVLGLGPQVERRIQPQLIPPVLFGKNEISPESTVVSLASGLNDFAAINSEGHLYTWGRNQHGVLGLGHQKFQFFPLRVNLAATVKKVAIGVDHMAAITKTFC